MINPCKDCKPPIRHYACHDTCPMREEWLNEQKRINDNMRSEKAINDAIVRRVVATKESSMKRDFKWNYTKEDL